MRALITTVAVLAFPCTALAAESAIQPGDWISTSGGGSCTLGWVFDGPAGEVFVSTASHCTDKIGEKIQFGDRALPVQTTEELGAVAYRGDPELVETDVALIRVREEIEHRVAGEMRGHPGIPSGAIEPVQAQAQDALQLSGWGMGFDQTAPTRESRQGFLLGGSVLRWEGVAPATGGDSGGPVAHVASGRALGLVKGHACDADGERICRSWGPSIAGIEAVAAQAGLKVTLRRAGEAQPAVPADPPAAPQETAAPPQSSTAQTPVLADEPAPAATVLSVQAPTRARRGGKLRVTVRGSRPLSDVKVTLAKGRTVASGRRASAGAVTLKLGRSIRPGRYRLSVTALDDLRRPVSTSVALAVRR